MYHQFFIASTCLLPFPFVVLVGSTTLSPYCLSYQDHPDASKIKILLRNMTTYFLSNTYLSLLSLLPLHLLSGYSFIIILSSTEIINGLSICIPSVTTYHFQLLAIITFFVCCLTNYLINSIIIWTACIQVPNTVVIHVYVALKGLEPLSMLFAMVLTFFLLLASVAPDGSTRLTFYHSYANYLSLSEFHSIMKQMKGL